MLTESNGRRRSRGRLRDKWTPAGSRLKRHSTMTRRSLNLTAAPRLRQFLQDAGILRSGRQPALRGDRDDASVRLPRSTNSSAGI